MKIRSTVLSVSLFLILLGEQNTYAMGLRSFVALPVEKGGTVMRFVAIHNKGTDTDVLKTGAAIGLTHKQTILLGLPYRLKPGGRNRTGDLSLLYRHILSQQDSPGGTKRLALLAGAIVPSDSQRDAGLQLGIVATTYQGRNSWDLDFLYKAGLEQRKDRAQYDISWQYRVRPAEYPDWGVGTEWDIVAELNGRWQENQNTTHQFTLGIQHIAQRWVLEGGIVQDLNNAEHTQFLISTRIHF